MGERGCEHREESAGKSMQVGEAAGFHMLGF